MCIFCRTEKPILMGVNFDAKSRKYEDNGLSKSGQSVASQQLHHAPCEDGFQPAVHLKGQDHLAAALITEDRPLIASSRLEKAAKKSMVEFASGVKLPDGIQSSLAFRLGQGKRRNSY
jgi:hypothetical protein